MVRLSSRCDAGVDEADDSYPGANTLVIGPFTGHPPCHLHCFQRKGVTGTANQD